jgi:hypothetical protein
VHREKTLDHALGQTIYDLTSAVRCIVNLTPDNAGVKPRFLESQQLLRGTKPDFDLPSLGVEIGA